MREMSLRRRKMMIKFYHPGKARFYIDDNPEFRLSLILGKFPLVDIEYSREGRYVFMFLLALGVEFNWLWKGC